MGNLSTSFIPLISKEPTKFATLCGITLCDGDRLLVQGGPKPVIDAVQRAIRAEWNASAFGPSMSSGLRNHSSPARSATIGGGIHDFTFIGHPWSTKPKPPSERLMAGILRALRDVGFEVVCDVDVSLTKFAHLWVVQPMAAAPVPQFEEKSAPGDVLFNPKFGSSLELFCASEDLEKDLRPMIQETLDGFDNNVPGNVDRTKELTTLAQKTLAVFEVLENESGYKFSNVVSTPKNECLVAFHAIAGNAPHDHIGLLISGDSHATGLVRMLTAHSPKAEALLREPLLAQISKVLKKYSKGCYGASEVVKRDDHCDWELVLPFEEGTRDEKAMQTRRAIAGIISVMEYRGFEVLPGIKLSPGARADASFIVFRRPCDYVERPAKSLPPVIGISIHGANAIRLSGNSQKVVDGVTSEVSKALKHPSVPEKLLKKSTAVARSMEHELVYNVFGHNSLHRDAAAIATAGVLSVVDTLYENGWVLRTAVDLPVPLGPASKARENSQSSKEKERESLSTVYFSKRNASDADMVRWDPPPKYESPRANRAPNSKRKVIRHMLAPTNDVYIFGGSGDSGGGGWDFGGGGD